MNVLITCHKPPGFDHPNLFQLNTNTYKANKTRKNTTKNLRHKGDTIYYLDTLKGDVLVNNKGELITNNNGNPKKREPPPNNTPNFFTDWSHIPENSMDIIWPMACPLLNALSYEEIEWNFLPEPRPFLDPPGEGYLDDIWRDLLGGGYRILKSGGKIIIPYPQSWAGFTSDSLQLKLIGRILNMEVLPESLYKIDVIEPLSKQHTNYLQNLYIVNRENFHLKMQNRSKVPVNLSKAYKFLVFEKP